jgi:carbamoyltransferase
MAGGVALNCVANGRVLREGPFEQIWIQPAAGDAGGALGAALLTWYQLYGKARQSDGVNDHMKGACLGPAFSDDEIGDFLKAKNYPAKKLDEENWPGVIAELIDQQKIIGLHQGRMEFGPRALGGRSIIGDARSTKMQSQMNLKIKYRESFRPFAPSCMVEKVGDYFDLDRASPYMLLVAQVKEQRCIGKDGARPQNMNEHINQARSDVPAITHIDYSARVQTVDPKHNPRYHDVIRSFYEKTGYGIIINTSFNVRGEPIVCTPEDAYRCFMRTEMDVLVLGSFILDKSQQPPWEEGANWRDELELD